VSRNQFFPGDQSAVGHRAIARNKPRRLQRAGKALISNQEEMVVVLMKLGRSAASSFHSLRRRPL
jgi:hypothetical protein